MKTYVYRMNEGYYVLMVNEQAEIVDEAGPFDDEYDAEMAARRAEEIAA